MLGTPTLPDRKGLRGSVKPAVMPAVFGSISGNLSQHGLAPQGDVHWNLEAPELIELAVERGEGVFSAHKALVTETGERTGRSPNDKFIVEESGTSDDINWGDVNVSTDLATFTALRAKVVDYLQARDALFVQDLYCGAEVTEALPIRVITHNAWHSAFARNMFVRPDEARLGAHEPQFTVLHAPHFEAVPDVDLSWIAESFEPTLHAIVYQYHPGRIAVMASAASA